MNHDALIPINIQMSSKAVNVTETAENTEGLISKQKGMPSKE